MKTLKSNRNRSSLFLILVFFSMSSLMSCTYPMLMVDSSLKNNIEEYDVKGKNALLNKKMLSFSNYTTTEVKRGIPRGGTWHLFKMTLNNTRHAFNFKLSDQSGMKSSVECLNRLTQKGFKILKNHVTIPLEHEDVFLSTMTINGEQWEMIISNVNNTEFPGRDRGGELVNVNTGRRILINHIRELEDVKEFIHTNIYGFEFIENGKSLAAVRTVNNGKVYLNKTIDKETEFIMANAVSALLLINELPDQL